MSLALARMIGAGQGGGDTAGFWLVRGQGLALIRQSLPGQPWQVRISPWLNSRQLWQGPNQWPLLRQERLEWMARHGLDRAEFPTRAAAATAVEYALARDPLAPVAAMEPVDY